MEAGMSSSRGDSRVPEITSCLYVSGASRDYDSVLKQIGKPPDKEKRFFTHLGQSIVDGYSLLQIEK